MTTETKFKGVEEILDELKAQAAKGSCKTCQFCLPIPNEYYGTSGYCGIQGNVNPMHFKESELEREAYPYGPCDDGNWTNIDDDGKRTQILGCLAYRPKTIESVTYGDATVTQQWAFMHLLAEAARLHNAAEDVKKGKLDELLEKLNTGNYGKVWPWE